MATEDQGLRTLSEVMAAEGLVSLSRTTELIEQIAAALDAARQRGIVVARLDPQSIFVGTVDEDGALHRSAHSPIDSNITRVLPFAATEQDPSGEQPTMTSMPVADDCKHQLALAGIAYEMLAGCTPFTDDATQVPLGVNLLFEPSGGPSFVVPPAAPPLSEMVVGVSHALDEVFQRALSWDPNQRFPSLNEFVSRLRRIDSATNQGTIAAANQATIEAASDTARAPAQETGRRTGGQTENLGPNGAVYTSLTGTIGDALSERSTAMVLEPSTMIASPPMTIIPSLRTKVSFLAATVLIVVSAIGVMSGSRKGVVAARPASEPTRAPLIMPSTPIVSRHISPSSSPSSPTFLSTPPSLVSLDPTQQSTAASATANAGPEMIRSDVETATPRRSRRPLSYRPRTARR